MRKKENIEYELVEIKNMYNKSNRLQGWQEALEWVLQGPDDSVVNSLLGDGPTIDQIKLLLCKLDSEARLYCKYKYGLPIEDEEGMNDYIDIVKKWIVGLST